MIAPTETAILARLAALCAAASVLLCTVRSADVRQPA
jgi:hypothetical protein